jgi:carbonic anhydrase
MITADEALRRLQDGNRRFLDRTAQLAVDKVHRQRKASQDQQQPFAIILGCSDSRVPAELVFDQGLGELFVIRIAGNIVASSQIGSIEYAARKFGVPLVVVMGHSSCGAVVAALEAAEDGIEPGSPHLGLIVGSILPALDPLLGSGLEGEQLLDAAVRENIRATVSQLCKGSQLLERLIEHDRLRIIGAHYSLATGEVEFL